MPWTRPWILMIALFLNYAACRVSIPMLFYFAEESLKLIP